MFLSIVARYVLPIAAVLSVVSSFFLVTQFKTVESLLGDTNSAFFEASVDSSYEIIDTSINDSIHYYLKGVAETSLNYILNLEEASPLTPAEQLSLIQTSLANIKIGDNGYAYLMDSQFNLLYHPYLQDQNIYDSPYVSKGEQPKSAFIEYLWKNPKDEEAIQKVAYRLILDDGRRLGISAYKSDLLHLIDKDKLKTKLADQSFGHTGFIYILNSAGEVLLYPDKDGTHISEFDNEILSELVRQSKKKDKGRVRFKKQLDSHNIEKDIVYRYYDYLDWLVVASIDKHELSHPVSVFISSVIVAVISLACVVTTLAAALNKRYQAAINVQRLDYLTGLRHRRSFIELVTPISKSPKRSHDNTLYSIILIDLDLFKQVNDSFGHEHGDLVIRSVAEVLLKYESHLVHSGRYGGEEFIIFTHSTASNDVVILAETIRQDIEQIQGLCKPITASLGVYSCFSNDVSLSRSISLADAALYQAKSSGRNKVMVSEHF